MNKQLIKALNYLGTIILTAAATLVVTYYATRNAEVAAANAEGATRYVDYQTFHEASWSPMSPVPGVQFSYTDKNGKKIDSISGMRINLYNFSDRDTTDLRVQVDALGAQGKPPSLLGFRVANGVAEDFEAEGVEQHTNGDTLSLVFKISRFNRKESLEPGRAISLYFSGMQAPVISVVASGNGFEGQAFEYAHYSDRELAKRPWTSKYGPYFVLIAAVLTGVGIFLLSVVSTHRRQVARMTALTDVIDGALAVHHSGMPPDQRRALASEIAFRCWQSIYDALSRVDRWLSPRPTKIP
ncbi:hypothetical protein [Paraburkholderia nodosa]|uniref:hypothetical protein n=1 Tax=Paraburkholderia nodosa TaxID=392320 RepID=UPI000841F346|nr:hypothetical protein [Paraburkholderia nodosa]